MLDNYINIILLYILLIIVLYIIFKNDVNYKEKIIIIILSIIILHILIYLEYIKSNSKSNNSISTNCNLNEKTENFENTNLNIDNPNFNNNVNKKINIDNPNDLTFIIYKNDIINLIKLVQNSSINESNAQIINSSILKIKTINNNLALFLAKIIEIIKIAPDNIEKIVVNDISMIIDLTKNIDNYIIPTKIIKTNLDNINIDLNNTIFSSILVQNSINPNLSKEVAQNSNLSN